MQKPLEDSRSDHELIAAANLCDAGAFEVLYYRHRDWVLQLAFRMTGDREHALDVLQETFSYFARKFPGFTLTCQLHTFLFPAVRNFAIAARRKAERLQPAGDDLMEDSLIDEGPTPSDGRQDDLLAALAGLPPEQREVLLLRFVDGLKLQEIADALGIPVGTAKSRLHNALNTLRQDDRTRAYLG